LFTNVPLRLPSSRIVNPDSLFAITACLRETVTSSRKISQSGERPIVISACSSGNVSPALPPPERTISAGPSIPSGSPSPSSSASSGVNVMVVSDSSGRTRCAPQRAQ
jgi:hypothetical protein